VDEPSKQTSRYTLKYSEKKHNSLYLISVYCLTVYFKIFFIYYKIFLKSTCYNRKIKLIIINSKEVSMLLDSTKLSEKIIVSKASIKSLDPHEIINSNIQYITKLFQHNVPDTAICEEALKSYYVDYYLSHIKYGGFSNFREHIETRPKTLYYIKEGLESIGAKNHLELLIHAIQIDYETLQSFALFKTLFSEFQEKENLTLLNSRWLKIHPLLLVLNEHQLESGIGKHIGYITKEERHVKIIKELCQIAKEEFIRITIGDQNNLYNDGSWYFKTDKGYYYMIENNQLVSMYDSETKELVVRGKVASTNSSFLTKMLG
jgi:hypothetical protein